jgi:hypothetical protein
LHHSKLRPSGSGIPVIAEEEGEEIIRPPMAGGGVVGLLLAAELPLCYLLFQALAPAYNAAPPGLPLRWCWFLGEEVEAAREASDPYQ